MPKSKHYIVEARLPIEINDASTPDQAARIAARIIQNRYGVDVSNWFLRVFEYGDNEDSVGPVEYFANPAGTKFRDRLQNIDIHEERIKEEDAEHG